jgi:Na+/phosphate symporter
MINPYCTQDLAMKHNGDVTRPRQAHGNLVVGIFSLVMIFFVAAWMTEWLLIWSGWNPLEGAVHAYSGFALAVTVAAVAVVAILRWARKQ